MNSCELCKESGVLMKCSHCTLWSCEPCINDWFKNPNSRNFTCPTCRRSRTFAVDYDKYDRNDEYFDEYDYLDDDDGMPVLTLIQALLEHELSLPPPPPPVLHVYPSASSEVNKLMYGQMNNGFKFPETQTAKLLDSIMKSKKQ